jgi:hypothetical protein
LEVLAHLNRFRIPERFRLLSIEVPDDAPASMLESAALPSDWRENLEIYAV